MYQLSIWLYGTVLGLAAYFYPKAKLWIDSRKDIFQQLSTQFQKETNPIIWMHCASLGEFEQGQPILAHIRTEFPNYKILLTFFSPSGLSAKSPIQVADYIFALPLDTRNNARQLLEIVQPKIVFFVKYEFWYFYLKALAKKEIPFFLVAGIFRKNQLFFKWFAKPYLEVVKGFTHLFLQDEASLVIAKNNGLIQSSIAGDPRVDRVEGLAVSKKEIPKIANFKKESLLCILGSTHVKDEVVFIEFLKLFYQKKKKNTTFNNSWKFLIVPHEVDEKNILRLQKSLPYSSERYSQVSHSQIGENIDYLILDTIGLLSIAYQYADVVFIGGGFDKSIHNTLEPAAFGLPIIFGPNYKKFKEAVDLIELGGATSINSAKEWYNLFLKLQKQEERISKGNISRTYIQSESNATKKIIFYLKNKNILK